MSVRLVDIASVIRSKNSGPGELTLDIIFTTREWFERIVGANAIDKDLIARLYHQDESFVQSVTAFAPASAIKVTIRRPVVSGAIGDSDVYGAQQHAPLLELTFEGLEPPLRENGSD